MDKKLSVGTRLGSMFLDHLIMTMFTAIFALPLAIKNSAEQFQEPTGRVWLYGPLGYLFLVGFTLYFNKDCINGRSLAKRITKLQVVDHKTGKVASPLKCFVRNIFIIIWLIEVIVVLFTPNRRIGDRVAGTKVIVYDASTQQPKSEIWKIFLPFILSLGIISMLYFLQTFKPAFQTLYSESSYNNSESKDLEKVFNSSLGKYLTASVRIYDTVQENKFKFIAINCRINNTAIDKDKLRDQIKKLLYSVYSEDSFFGEIRYVYEKNSFMQVSRESIGTFPKIVSK